MKRQVLSQTFAGLVLSISLLGLISWIFDIPFLRNLRSEWGYMKFNTAVGFLLSSLCLGLIQTKKSLLSRLTAIFCSLLLLLIGLLTLSEHMIGWNLGIDQLFFRPSPSMIHVEYPGRMSPAAATTFFLLGSAFILDFCKKQKSAQVLNLVALGIPIFALIGYAYDVGTLMTFWPYASMAVHTALAFILVALGLMIARWEIVFSLIRSVGFFLALLILILVGGVFYQTLQSFHQVVQGDRQIYETLIYPQERAALLVLMVGSGMSLFLLLLIFFLFKREISKREKTEKTVQSLNETLKKHACQLEASNRELEAFSYSVSHDLRAPLRKIDGFSQAVLEDYSDHLDEQGKNFLQRIRAGSQMMGQLIDDLLSLSRMTRSEMRHEEVNLSQMAESIFSDLQKSDPDRSVEWVVMPNLKNRGDKRLLQVVLVNLLGNAWKFTAKKEKARIEFGFLKYLQEEANVYFVRDNGAGFDMTYADKLFGAFQRLHSVSEFAGTGIGLATVQRIIHRHGGRVWTEGKAGEGATFYFTLGES